MPFGARVLDDGRVRFRLWAPGAREVKLCLQGLAPTIASPTATTAPIGSGEFQLPVFSNARRSQESYVESSYQIALVIG